MNCTNASMRNAFLQKQYFTLKPKDRDYKNIQFCKKVGCRNLIIIN